MPPMSITAGVAQGLERIQAARYAFLLGVPAIAGAGLLSMVDLISEGTGITASILVGTLVAGVAGYFAIALLIRILTQVGLAPFGIYCVVFGAFSLFVL